MEHPFAMPYTQTLTLALETIPLAIVLVISYRPRKSTMRYTTVAWLDISYSVYTSLQESSLEEMEEQIWISCDLRHTAQGLFEERELKLC